VGKTRGKGGCFSHQEFSVKGGGRPFFLFSKKGANLEMHLKKFHRLMATGKSKDIGIQLFCFCICSHNQPRFVLSKSQDSSFICKDFKKYKSPFGGWSIAF